MRISDWSSDVCSSDLRLRKMPHLEQVVWSQEEPKNNGYWTFVEPFVEHCMGEAGVKAKRPAYAGRAPSASPATGLAKRQDRKSVALGKSVSVRVYLGGRRILKKKRTPSLHNKK